MLTVLTLPFTIFKQKASSSSSTPKHTDNDRAAELGNISMHVKLVEGLLKTKFMNWEKWKKTAFGKLFFTGYIQNKVIAEELKKAWKLEKLTMNTTTSGIVLLLVHSPLQLLLLSHFPKQTNHSKIYL